MADIPWSLEPEVDEVAPTDKLMRSTPSRTIKNQEISVDELSVFVTEYGLHTGVRTGLELSINADNTKFDIAAGTGIIVNNDPDPENPTITRIVRNAELAIDDLFLTSLLTFVFMDSAGLIVQRDTTPPSSLDDLSDLIFLGQIRHNASVIVLIDDNPIMAHGSSSSHLAELVLSGGVRLTGSEISPASTDLTVDIAAGILEQFGRGRAVSENNPNEFTSPLQAPIPVGRFFKLFVDSMGDVVADPSTNTLDPTQFNSGGLGTLVSVSPSNNYTVVRVFIAAGSNAVIFYYGTEQFSDSASALAAVEPTFVEHSNTIQTSPIAKIAIKGNVIDFTAALANGDAVIQQIMRRV